MFYYNPERGWGVHPKKITYTEQVTTYGPTDEPYQDKADMVSEEIVLTEEQMRRLTTIKNVDSMGVEDVKKYVLEGIIEDQQLVNLKEEVKAEETRQKLARLIRWDELTTEDMLELLEDFKEYEVGSFYVVGDIFNYNNQLYKVLQPHTSQDDWKPNEVPALYLSIAPPATEDGTEIVADWIQPTGAHDAYNKGDRVTFEGLVYESLIDGNTWSPTAYPQGWIEIVN